MGNNTNLPFNLNDDFTKFREEIKNLKKKIETDRSISILLTIFSIIFTIFMATIVGFGFYGFSSISGTKKEIDDFAKDAKETLEFVEKNIKVLSDDLVKKSEELALFNENMKNVQDNIKNEINSIKVGYDNLSKIFNDVYNYELLNSREKRLLVTLASKVDSDNPYYHYNAAQSFLAFGDFEEAKKHLDLFFELENKPLEIIEEAKALMSLAKSTKPQKYLCMDPKGIVPKLPDVNTQELFKIHINILNFMYHNGYLSREQYENILGSYKGTVNELFDYERPGFLKRLIEDQK